MNKIMNNYKIDTHSEMYYYLIKITIIKLIVIFRIICDLPTII